MARLDALIGGALLGGDGRGWPGVLFDHGVVASLYTTFLTHHYSAGIIRQGLRLATLQHFRSAPAAALPAAAAAGRDALAAACEDLPAAGEQRRGPHSTHALQCMAA